MSTTLHLRVRDDLRGRMFRGAMQEFVQSYTDIISRLHQMNIWKFDVRVVTGEIMLFTLPDAKSAMAFKLAFSDQIVPDEEVAALLADEKKPSPPVKLKPSRSEVLMEVFCDTMYYLMLGFGSCIASVAVLAFADHFFKLGLFK